MGLETGKFTRTALLLFSMLGSLSAAPKLRLATTTVGPYSIGTGTNGAEQSVEAYNAGDGSLALTATSSVSWLTASVGASGPCRSVSRTACLPIQIGFQTASLSTGMRTGDIAISDPNALDAPQTITVTVQIGGGIPDKIDLYVAPNGSSASATMSSNTFLPFSTATENGGRWLAVAASGAGSFRFGVTYGVAATHQGGMGEGDYGGSIGFSGSSFAPDNKTVRVVMHVTSSPIAEVPQQMKFRMVHGSAKQTQQLNINNRGGGILTFSGVTASGGAWLSAGGPGSAVDITADPSGLGPGVYTGSLSVASNAANGTVTVPVELAVIAAAPPFAYFGGAINIGTWTANDPAAQGDIVAVFGEQLSDQARGATAVPLATKIGPTRVLVNGLPAPLYYASYGQVNIQIPFETAPGDAVVRVERDGQLGNSVSIQVAARAPHILPFGEYGIIHNYSQNITFPMPPTPGVPTSRAHAGDVFVIWTIGLGQGSPAVATGAGAPGAEGLSRIPTRLKVYFGDRFLGSTFGADPLDVVMTPTLVGLYQVSVIVPQGTPKGDRIPLYLDIGDRISNQVLVAIE